MSLVVAFVQVSFGTTDLVQIVALATADAVDALTPADTQILEHGDKAAEEALEGGTYK